MPDEFTYAAGVITTGTIATHVTEHWSVWHSLYFTVVTSATVGYGDLSPKTPAGQAVTIVLIVAGIMAHAAFLHRAHCIAARIKHRPRKPSARPVGPAVMRSEEV